MTLGEKIPCCIGELNLRQQSAGPDAQTTALHPHPREHLKTMTPSLPEEQQGECDVKLEQLGHLY